MLCSDIVLWMHGVATFCSTSLVCFQLVASRACRTRLDNQAPYSECWWGPTLLEAHASQQRANAFKTATAASIDHAPPTPQGCDKQLQRDSVCPQHAPNQHTPACRTFVCLRAAAQAAPARPRP